MKKLTIVNKNGYLYTLEDETKEYNLMIEFFDIAKIPTIGESIYMNEELLNSHYEGYSTSYTFGNLDNKYGKENISRNDVDIIKIILDDEEIYLKRLYG